MKRCSGSSGPRPAGTRWAQELLGLAYLRGTYRDEDPAQAFRWFMRAAKTAAPAVRPRVGEALLMGAETTPDPVHAYALALIAESLDTDGAADRIGLLSHRLTKTLAEDAHRLLGPGFFAARTLASLGDCSSRRTIRLGVRRRPGWGAKGGRPEERPSGHRTRGRKSVVDLRRQPGIDAIPDLRIRAVAHGHVVEQRAERIDELCAF